jgi:hypothetical protein
MFKSLELTFLKSRTKIEMRRARWAQILTLFGKRIGSVLELSICVEVVRVLVESFVFRVIFPVPAPVSVGLKL